MWLWCLCQLYLIQQYWGLQPSDKVGTMLRSNSCKQAPSMTRSHFYVKCMPSYVTLLCDITQNCLTKQQYDSLSPHHSILHHYLRKKKNHCLLDHLSTTFCNDQPFHGSGSSKPWEDMMLTQESSQWILYGSNAVTSVHTQNLRKQKLPKSVSSLFKP